MSYLAGIERVAQNIGHENILINGGFEIWQRGTSFSTPADGAYTADRWQNKGATGPTFTITQENGAGNVDNGQYSLKLNVTVTGSGVSASVAQWVENYQYYAGKTISASVRVKTTITKVRLQIDTGVGGAYSAYHSGSGNWETLTITYAVESNVSALGLYIGQRNEGSNIQTGIFYADSAMMVVGTEPQAFVPLIISDDLARCQRYYEKGTITDTIDPIQRLSGANATYPNNLNFKQTKATVPTVTTSNLFVALRHLPTTGNTETSNDTANWTSNSYGPTIEKTGFILVRGTDQTTFPLLDWSLNWAAETT